MSEANKMFEELGYKKYESEIGVQYIREGIDRIEFDKNIKIVKSYVWNDGFREIVKSINSYEAKAIYKKCEELGWI